MIQVQSALEKHTGIYTVAEAAHYARIPITTLRRWLEANKAGHRLLTRSRHPEERFLTFHDFVQLLAVRAIRSQHHVKLADIYEAVDEAERTHCIRYPFAREHTTWLFEKKIVIRLDDTDEMIQLAGKGKGQTYLTRIIEMYLQDLSYDAEGLAEKYRPFPGIVMNPAIRFGEPMVESCGITAQTLWDSVQAEGGFTPAAEVHGVEPGDVITACRYIDLLESRLAA